MSRFNDDMIQRKGLPWDVRELLHDLCYDFPGRHIYPGLEYKTQAQKIMKAAKTPPHPKRFMECDQCDGCGWVEGGETLTARCTTCHGKGKVRV